MLKMRVTYLSEGNRHVVFREGGSVLRVSKHADLMSEDIFLTVIEQYVDCAVPIFTRKVTADFINQLNGILVANKSTRTAQGRSGMLPETSKVLVSPLLSGTFAVELKPKWLALYPNAKGHEDGCRMCLMGSSFCPLELLSMDSMHYAIDKMISEPRNFLRVWLNGKMQTNLSEYRKDIYSAVGRALPLLNKLADAQKQLDQYGIEKVFAIYQTLQPKEPLLLEDWKSDDCQMRVILDYLVCMTLRDCSIIISENIHVIDLGPKSVHKIPEWFKKERVKLYSDTF